MMFYWVLDVLLGSSGMLLSLFLSRVGWFGFGIASVILNSFVYSSGLYGVHLSYLRSNCA